MRNRNLLSVVVLTVTALHTTTQADDWSTYRHDAARSGITRDAIRTPLAEHWTFQSSSMPDPAWGDPKPEPVADILELRRIHFDDVFQPIMAEGRVYFGSSSDGKVYCLDAETGQVVWRFTTGGPVRLAPSVVDGRIYFGSDDGWAYCLDAKSGNEVWKFHAAPEDRRVIGNGRLISLWPMRAGVLVDDGIAYFAAGIFPAEGVFLYAVDAETGEELWRNDATGEDPRSRISPQGYMLASDTMLYAPMGRVSPAAFDRTNGQLQHETFFGKTVGGTYALLAGQHIYTGTEEMVAYDRETKDRFASFQGRKMVVTDEVAYLASGKELAAVDRESRKGIWKIECDCYHEMILAGETLFVGGDGRVLAIDAKSGNRLWTGEVDGAVKGLAASDGHLVASTDRGVLRCFGSPQKKPSPTNSVQPFTLSLHHPEIERAAKQIIQRLPVDRGHCLVWVCQSGNMVDELVTETDLHVHALCAGPHWVEQVRQRLEANPQAGARVTVETWPLDDVPYPDYFANLIVSEWAVLGKIPGKASEMLRMLKPLGGTALIKSPEPIDDWLAEAMVVGEYSIEKDGEWTTIVRGAIPGAGSWTHQYAEPGNTACGDDQVIKAPLGVLWFGDPGPGDMVERHLRAAAPLSLDGRMFVEGENVVMAYDAYNGVKFWRREIPGARRVSVSHDCSNMAVSAEGLFVAVGDHCLQLDPAGGETLVTHQMPKASGSKKQQWNYVAVVDGVLYGSRGTAARKSDCVFAIRLADGQLLWKHESTDITNATISIGDGHLLLVSREVNDDERMQAIDENERLGDGLPVPEPEKADVRRVIALDATTGQALWSRPLDTSLCDGTVLGSESQAHFGSRNLAAIYQKGAYVLFCIYLDGHHWKQFLDGQFADRRVTVLDVSDGSMLWTKAVGFRVRPLVIGDTLHAEPWAFDLRSGEMQTREHPVTGMVDAWQYARPGHHCGAPAASENLMLFRGWNLGYYDLNGDYGTMHFGGQRPGCWLNFIPAGGLLLMPEASAGCMCDFPTMCSVVFQPSQEQKAWAWYSAVGPMTPVKRLGLNFGAPGDRNDAEGNLWLAYPRPDDSRRPKRVFAEGTLVMDCEPECEFSEGGDFETGNSVYTVVDGTSDPWLFASSARGLRRCVIPLIGEGEGKGTYGVRLSFVGSTPDQDARPFDLRLQGETVGEGLNIARAADGNSQAVTLTFDGIEVDGDLTIELVTNDAAGGPVLCAVEVVREKMLAMGCAVPSFELSNITPELSGTIRLADFRDTPLQGDFTLQLDVPEGFRVQPETSSVAISTGKITSVPVAIQANPKLTAGEYPMSVLLVDGAGAVKFERSVAMTHLGRLTHRAFIPVEDAVVSARYPDKPAGTAADMSIDGGSKAVGDIDHKLIYLKFQLDHSLGTPVSVELVLHNSSNPSRDSGNVCLVEEPWKEREITYNARPTPGRVLAPVGRVEEFGSVRLPLEIDLSGVTELSVVLDPTTTDATRFFSREGDKPPELVVEYSLSD